MSTTQSFIMSEIVTLCFIVITRNKCFNFSKTQYLLYMKSRLMALFYQHTFGLSPSSTRMLLQCSTVKAKFKYFFKSSKEYAQGVFKEF